MKDHLNIWLPTRLLEQLNAFAAAHNLNRSEATRLAIWRMLNAPEAYVAPTLPNWQVEAWTSLLRGLFGSERLVLTDDIKALLVGAVTTLDERDKQVLMCRFGLAGPRYTLKEVGAMQGVNRQRVHQIEAKALRRLRGWSRQRGIWELVGPQLNEEKAQ